MQCDIHSRTRLTRVIALEEIRSSARELEVLDTAASLRLRLAESLPLFSRDPVRDLLPPRDHRITNRKHQLRPSRKRNRAPHSKRLLRRLNSGINLGLARQIDQTRLHTRRRINTGAVRPDLPETRTPPIQ